MSRQGYYSDEILRFAHDMKESGWPDHVVAAAKSCIRGYMLAYGDTLSLNKILAYDFDRYSPEASPALVLYMFMLWRYDHIRPITYNRRKGIKDGFSRPINCKRTGCRYNSTGRCRYQPHIELDSPFKWRTCVYYEQAKPSDERDVVKPVKIFNDRIYGRRSSYLDSHSARWIE